MKYLLKKHIFDIWTAEHVTYPHYIHLWIYYITTESRTERIDQIISKQTL